MMKAKYLNLLLYGELYSCINWHGSHKDISHIHKKMKIRLEPFDILKCGIWLADKILLIQAMKPLALNQRLISEISYL